MIQINILEPNDILKPDDYCRPLYITQGHEDCVMTRSLYSGTPCNNMKWTLVRNVFGECWWNQHMKFSVKLRRLKEILRIWFTKFILRKLKECEDV